MHRSDDERSTSYVMTRQLLLAVLIQLFSLYEGRSVEGLRLTINSARKEQGVFCSEYTRTREGVQSTLLTLQVSI